MEFGGFQKLSLLNYPDKMAAVVFANGCNFRCPYCHNAGLLGKGDRRIDLEEIFAYLQKRRGLLEAVCVSGGEPLMNDDIFEFLRELKKMQYAVKVDTNGSYPDRLEKIIADGLADYIAMDVKNTLGKYADTIGLRVAPAEQIRQSIELLKQGRIPYEFRTTIIKEFHTADDIAEIAVTLKGAEVWYLQLFQDSPEVPQKGLHAPAETEIKSFGSIGNRYVNTMIRKGSALSG